MNRVADFLTDHKQGSFSKYASTTSSNVFNQYFSQFSVSRRISQDWDQILTNGLSETVETQCQSPCVDIWVKSWAVFEITIIFETELTIIFEKKTDF